MYSLKLIIDRMILLDSGCQRQQQGRIGEKKLDIEDAQTFRARADGKWASATLRDGGAWVLGNWATRTGCRFVRSGPPRPEA